MNRRLLTAWLAALWCPIALAQTPSIRPMKIRLTLGDRVLTATLADSASTRDFVSLLPLRLTLEDYAATEKIAPLPRKLNTRGAPAGIDPTVGDITYYAPWGNLALFHRDFGYSTGLVRLGRLDNGAALLAEPGRVPVLIEAIEP